MPYEHTAFDASAIEVAESANDSKKIVRTVASQLSESTNNILANLLAECNYGTKQNSNGKTHTWKGYKLHAIVNEYNIPIASIVTAASVHDSLCAIPLVRMAEDRVDALYYLGDKGYDAAAIRTEIESCGKVALIDFKRLRNGELSGEFIGNQVERYNKRTFAESVFSQLKMNYLPRYILYRGIEKVRSVLNFALSVIMAVQILKYS